MVKVKSKSEHVAPLLMRLKWFLSSSGKSQLPSWVKEGLHHLPLSTAPTSHLITSPIVRVAGANSLGAGWGLPTLEPRATKYKSPWRQWARLVLGRKNKGQVDQMALHVHGIQKQKEALATAALTVARGFLLPLLQWSSYPFGNEHLLEMLIYPTDKRGISVVNRTPTLVP